MSQILKTITFKGQALSYSCYFAKSPQNSDAQQQLSPTSPLTLMLVHGFPENGLIFNTLAATLSLQYNLIVPDLPGSGRSPYNPSLHSTTDFADALEAIIAAECIDKLAVAGHSMGGYIALAFGEKYPEKLLGLGLLHSTAYPDSEQKKANRLKAIQTMARYGGPAFLKSMVPNLFGDRFKAQHQQVILDLIQAGHQFETRALQQYYQMMHDRPDRTALLTKLQIPFLLISGTQDKAAPASDLIQQAALADAVMIEILEDTGHMGFLEKPEAVQKIIHQFMQWVRTLHA